MNSIFVSVFILEKKSDDGLLWRVCEIGTKEEMEKAKKFWESFLKASEFRIVGPAEGTLTYGE